MYMIVLSGYLPEMAKAEAESMIKAMKGSVKKVDNNLMFFEVKNVSNLYRLGLAHSVHEVLLEANKKNFFDAVQKMKKIKGPIAVRVKFMGDKKPAEKKIIDAVWRQSDRKVNLCKPKNVINVFVVEKRVIVTRLVFEIDKSFIGSLKKMPFKKPITMDPRIARAMINLTGLTKGRILDPFCGTGALLKEAATVGLRCYGSDISEDMVKGAQKNLAFFGLKAVLRKADATKLKSIWHKKFDAIVTDPPYGISTSLFNKNLKELYTKSLRSMKSVLKPGGCVVIAVPKKLERSVIINARKLGFAVDTRIEQRVHKSLRRVFVRLYT
ncbi:MAG: methyltransferase domain-containing protein [Candidatus Aenigmarchaeota archaeon]|nr:methyltransferase domain-containing protein [Candidatus Aenigmarchaeota archaeon]